MSVHTLADPADPDVQDFLADLWRLSIKHGLLIEENATIIVMAEQDFALGGYDLTEYGDLLPGKRGPTT